MPTRDNLMAGDDHTNVYSAVLNQRSTFESDITAQRIFRNHYRLFVSTAAIKRYYAWFSRAILQYLRIVAELKFQEAVAYK